LKKKLLEPKFDDVSLLEFVARTYDIRYLVDPILPAGGVGIVHGKAGHGKSQWMLSLMDALSCGGLFLGKYKTTESKLLYIQADMPENLFNERLVRAISEFRAPENIVIAQTRAFDIFDPRAQDALANLQAKHTPSMVVVDTLRKTMTEDENSAIASSMVYATWQEIMQAGIFFQHHDRKSHFVPKGSKKDDGSEADPEAHPETFRGNRSWVDDSDLGIHLYKFARDNKIIMNFSKWRCEPQPTMVLSMNPETLLVEPKRPETAKEWAYKLSGNGLSTREWAKAVMDNANVKDSMAYKAIGEVVAEMTNK